MQAIETREILLPQSNHLLRIHRAIMQKSYRLLQTADRAASKKLQNGIRVSQPFSNDLVYPLSASHRRAASSIHNRGDKILLSCAQVASSTRMLRDYIPGQGAVG